MTQGRHEVVGVYLAGPLGFTEPGRQFHDGTIVPLVRAAGFDPLDPWPLGGRLFPRAAAIQDPRSRERALRRANRLVGQANEGMIRACSGVLAILDGSDVDSGTAAEVGFAAALSKPVVGLRTDLRSSGDNAQAAVNLQVLHFVRMGGGTVHSKPENAVRQLKRLIEKR